MPSSFHNFPSFFLFCLVFVFVLIACFCGKQIVFIQVRVGAGLYREISTVITN